MCFVKPSLHVGALVAFDACHLFAGADGAYGVAYFGKGFAQAYGVGFRGVVAEGDNLTVEAGLDRFDAALEAEVSFDFLFATGAVHLRHGGVTNGLQLLGSHGGSGKKHGQNEDVTFHCSKYLMMNGLLKFSEVKAQPDIGHRAVYRPPDEGGLEVCAPRVGGAKDGAVLPACGKVFPANVDGAVAEPPRHLRAQLFEGVVTGRPRLDAGCRVGRCGQAAAAVELERKVELPEAERRFIGGSDEAFVFPRQRFAHQAAAIGSLDVL